MESREQLQEVAARLCALPEVEMIRGGVWKPRTRPGGFEGLGEVALGWMQEVTEGPLRMADGGRVRFCCEVARPEHVELCLRHGVHDVWLGARTTGSPFMVEELCEALRGTGMRVMVKNPTSPDVSLWMGTIERVQRAIGSGVRAVHRGFAMYNNRGYRNAPLWEVAMELRRAMPEVPLLCDPSHIGGRRELVAALCHTALLLAYDGLMVEVHPKPEAAWTDAAQQVEPEALARLLGELEHEATGAGAAEPELGLLRAQIDATDHELLQLLARRMGISRQIAEVKRGGGLAVYQPDRWKDVVADRQALARRLGLDDDFVRDVLERIHAESVRVQLEG